MTELRTSETIGRLELGSLRAATSAERIRAEGRAGWQDRSYLELSGTPEGLRALAALLVEAAATPGQRVVLDPALLPGLATREWTGVAVACSAKAAQEAAPAVQLAVIERTSDAHRRDKLVVEVQNRLASTVRVSGFRFETEALASAGNADLTIHGGRVGRFSMFVPSETRQLALRVDGFTDLAGNGAPWTIGRRERSEPLPERATRSPLEDRIM